MIVRNTMQMEHVCAIKEEIMRVVILHLHVIQIIIVAPYLPRPTQTRLVRRDGILLAIHAYKFVQIIVKQEMQMDHASAIKEEIIRIVIRISRALIIGVRLIE